MLQKISKLLKLFKPPLNWRLPVLILLGIFAGFVLLMLHISRATSYLSDNPATCINCHVMIPQFATWKNSSHARVATCNDCHVPQDNVFRKYLFKAQDGLRHAYVFTTRQEPQVIHATEMAKEAIQENCLRCHGNLIHTVSLKQVSNMDNEDVLLCWDCHRETPHGRVRSLSTTPFAYVPRISPIFSEWIKLSRSLKE